jgi:YegS/Rv2252/BmrU family lipid kinase
MTQETATPDRPAADAPPVFIVFNPVAGTTDAEQFRTLLADRFQARGRPYELYETTGADDEDVAALVRAAYKRGVRCFAAAGGDGTVSAVADGLAHSEATLAILPVGTANVLARELGIPADAAGAVELLLDAPAIRPIDVMRVGKQLFVLHIAVGITSLMHRDTSREAKRRFGRLAYVATALRWIFDFQPQRFSLVIDGERHRRDASTVVAANGTTLGVQPFTWAEDGDPGDGVVELIVVRANALRDYLGLAWSTLTSRHRHNPRIKIFKVKRTISISTRKALPVQGDGELIGDTPVQIEIEPAALRIVVPAETEAAE